MTAIHTALLGTGTALPAARYTTDDLLTVVGERVTPALEAGLRATGVEARHFAVANVPELLVDPEVPAQTTVGPSELAVTAVRRALGDAGVAAERVGLLVAVTNTHDRILPGLAPQMLECDDGLLARDVTTVNMHGQGCSALLKALEVAGWYLAGRPGEVALVVAAEVQSPYMRSPRFGDRPLRSLRELRDEGGTHEEIASTVLLTQAFLFGDGAVALVVGGGAGLGAERFAHLTNADAGDAQLLAMANGDAPTYSMGPAVPARGAAYAHETWRKLGEPTQDEPNGAYLIHTGSRKILDGVLAQIGVSPSDARARPSYDVLAEVGNLSSASVGFMLAATHRSLDSAVCLAFGVGFSATAAVFTTG